MYVCVSAERGGGGERERKREQVRNLFVSRSVNQYGRIREGVAGGRGGGRERDRQTDRQTETYLSRLGSKLRPKCNHRIRELDLYGGSL